MKTIISRSLVRKIILCFSFVSIGLVSSSKTTTLTLDSTMVVSVLTCTPGSELYSTFGHSAIRIRSVIYGSQGYDIIYNYGTFDGYQDGFYMKFARGKLDYSLSRYDFKDFNSEYLNEGRGVTEQVLDLSVDESNHLFLLLEENYKPENRNYRYDFFYDNCATRIEQILRKATHGKLEITDVHADQYTFRSAIDTYLKHHPWSDYGIDLALGLPCDKKMAYGQSMFLPDSVFKRLAEAKIDGRPLIGSTEEILLPEVTETEPTIFSPLNVNIAWLLVCVVVGLIFLKKRKYYIMTDRLTMFFTGIIGLVLVFLWFFTDHTATAYNFNLLWANPINLVIAVLPSTKLLKWRKYITTYMAVLGLLLICWYFLPQRLHIAVIPIVLALLFAGVRLMRTR